MKWKMLRKDFSKYANHCGYSCAVGITLTDIGALAGVSTATVSRVLNNKPGVGATTRQSVLVAVQTLGYEVPEPLRPRFSDLVAMIVPELENPVFPHFAQVISLGLAQHGYTSVLCTQTAGTAGEDQYVQMLLDRQVAGIIFVSGIHAVAATDISRYTSLTERKLPIVLINGYLNGVDAPFVSNDDATAVDLAVAHLVQLGHRQIGLALGQRRYTPTIRKMAGFAAAMERHVGVDAETSQHLVECTTFSVEGGSAAAQTLLDRGCTALVCGSDLMALGVIRAVHQRGLTVPGDVSVVGSDDSSLLAFTDPPLTTVRQPVAAMGNAAVRALLDLISGGPAPRAEYLFRPELVVRGSTAAAPAGENRAATSRTSEIRIRLPTPAQKP